MQKKRNIIVFTALIIVAIAITFETTYLLLNWRNKRDYRELSASYTDSLNEYASQIENLKKENKELMSSYENNKILDKVAIIDFLYRNGYVHDRPTDEEAEEILANAYIYAMGDKYASYYNKEDYKNLVDKNNGSLVGIGVQVVYNEEHEAIEILLVMEGSPASEAGIKKGDLIVSVAGETVSSLGYEQAINNVKGEEGTSVELKILRDGKEITLTSLRRTVESQSVIYNKFENDPKIGIVKVLEFNFATPEQFKNAVSSLIDDGVESLVFDMRSNPGGMLDAVVEMLDYLLPEGDIVHIVSKSGVVETYKSKPGEINVPMAVLINENTASAAELFTAALKDYNKVTVVGTTSYGKGTVQTIIPLGDGSALSYSTYMYNPPFSENYEGKGIEPDKIVEPNEIIKNNNLLKVEQKDDNQLIEACKVLGYENKE